MACTSCIHRRPADAGVENWGTKDVRSLASIRLYPFCLEVEQKGVSAKNQKKEMLVLVGLSSHALSDEVRTQKHKTWAHAHTTGRHRSLSLIVHATATVKSAPDF